MLAAIGHIETVVVQAVGNNFVAHLDDQLQKALVVAFNGDVQPGVVQPINVF